MSQLTSGLGHYTGFGHGGRGDHTEGVVARTIEEQTAKLPSDLFLWAAGASIVGSLALQQDRQGRGVGRLPPLKRSRIAIPLTALGRRPRGVGPFSSRLTDVRIHHIPEKETCQPPNRK